MKNLIAILFAAAMFAGCVRQDLPDNWDGRGCRVLFGLEFHYTFDGSDQVENYVKDIHLYVFDSETGVLYDIIDISAEEIARGGRIPASLPPGKFDFIAWGSGNKDITTGGFHESHMQDAQQQMLVGGVTKGVTTLDDFRMILGMEQQGDYAVPRVSNFDDIFFAESRKFEIMGDKDQTVTFDFVRNSHMLLITVEGVQHVLPATRAEAECPLTIYVTGRNGSYCHDNTIDPYSPLLRYESAPHTVTKNEVKSDIKVLRLVKAMHIDDNTVDLVVEDKESGREIARIDVLKYITERIVDENGALKYPEQEDINKEKEFHIPLKFEPDGVNGGFTISIKDWVIGRYKPTEIIPWIPKTE